MGKRAAESIVAEIGVDMGVFPTASHFAWWAGQCPGNNVTGGKRRSGKTNKGGDYFLRRDADRHRQRLVSQLQALGYCVTLEPVAAA